MENIMIKIITIFAIFCKCLLQIIPKFLGFYLFYYQNLYIYIFQDNKILNNYFSYKFSTKLSIKIHNLSNLRNYYTIFFD